MPKRLPVGPAPGPLEDCAARLTISSTPARSAKRVLSLPGRPLAPRRAQ